MKGNAVRVALFEAIFTLINALLTIILKNKIKRVSRV